MRFDRDLHISVKPSNHMNITGEHFILIIGPPNTPGVNLPAVQLTREGMEIARILPNDEMGGLTLFSEVLLKQIKTARIHRIIERKGDEVAFDGKPVKTLRGTN